MIFSMYQDIFKFKIPQHKPKIEKIMDMVISNKDGFEVSDPIFLRRLGSYIQPLRQHRLIGLYHEPVIGNTIIKIRNTNDIMKDYGADGTIEYKFFLKPKRLDFP